MGTLIADLADRGLLDSTIVWWGGEFGRTPKVDWKSPWNGGRHHYGHVFSVGRGRRRIQGRTGGRRLRRPRASTSRTGPSIRAISSAPCTNCSGIDPDASLPHPMGEFVRAVPERRRRVGNGRPADGNHLIAERTMNRFRRQAILAVAALLAATLQPPGPEGAEGPAHRLRLSRPAARGHVVRSTRRRPEHQGDERTLHLRQRGDGGNRQVVPSADTRAVHWAWPEDPVHAGKAGGGAEKSGKERNDHRPKWSTRRPASPRRTSRRWRSTASEKPTPNGSPTTRSPKNSR